jgi:hypothetical protein
MTTVRWHDKADAFVHGWRERLGVDPPLNAVVLGLAVAQHETACGDAWAGEHNWGAVQKRVLNAEEKTLLSSKGIVPYHRRVVRDGKPVTESSVPAARAAIAEAGLPLDREALHIDSSPGKGWYFVYFWAFPNDVEGASFFIKILAVNRASCRAVMLNDKGTEHQLAEGMYNSRYYEGFYERGAFYSKGTDGKWHKLPAGASDNAVKGETLNIKAYGGALAAITPKIRQALVDWHPPSGEPTEDPAPDTEPVHPTEPAPPLIQLEVDWDEIRRDRDDYIRDWD